MDKTFSLYLDSVRFAAAVLVVISHYMGFGIVDRVTAGYLPEFGREAVIVFFVLSGYVIGHTTTGKQHTLREYAVARCARIYSVAAPILILAFVVAFVAIRFGNGEVAGRYTLEKLYLYVPFHLLFLGEVWNLSEVPPWLGAYWSLGFEVWYYILFGALCYLTGLQRVIAVLIIAAVMGHKLWLLMPVWFAGVLLHKWQGRLRLKSSTARGGWIATIFVLIFYKALGFDLLLRELGNQIWGFPSFRLGSADRYLADYVVCVLVVLNFTFALHAKFDLMNKCANVIKSLSSYTFTLYLVHGLIMSAWIYFYKNRTTNFDDVLLLTVLIGLFTYLLGAVTEHQKHVFHWFFSHVFGTRNGTSPGGYRYRPGGTN